MTVKSFTSPELEVLYQIIKDYQENALKSDEKQYNEYEQTIPKEIISAILKKMAQKLPKENKEEIDKDFLRQKYHPYNNQINEKTYSILKKALDQLKTIEIGYFNMDSAEFKKRRIDIYYISTKYTIGYCHLRNSIRKFRTNKIASAKLTNQNYRIPKNFNKNKY